MKAPNYHRRALPLDVEDFARPALVRILPRGRYRLAAQNDSRFQSFAGSTARIAYRQQGATPAFLLFCGPGQDAQSAARAAAAWAAASWRPNAVQRRVRPGVVAVHVAPAAELAPAGIVAGSAVPAAVWTVDGGSGRVRAEGRPPGSPAPGELKSAAEGLLKGAAVPTLGELDLAERSVMQVRTVGMPPLLTGVVSICLLLVVLRFGLAGLFSLFALPALIAGGNLLAIGSALVSVLFLAGLVLGLALLLNLGNLAFRAPGFSSLFPRTRNLAWGGFAAVMVALLFVQQAVLPGALSQAAASRDSGQYLHATATVDDDGGETYVATGGDLRVDLSGWPSSEWKGVVFKTSNPSVLPLNTAQGDRPVALFDADADGVSRVDAASADGRYTFQLRVDVGPAP